MHEINNNRFVYQKTYIKFAFIKQDKMTNKYSCNVWRWCKIHSKQWVETKYVI